MKHNDAMLWWQEWEKNEAFAALPLKLPMMMICSYATLQIPKNS